jgi:protein TonB
MSRELSTPTTVAIALALELMLFAAAAAMMVKTKAPLAESPVVMIAEPQLEKPPPKPEPPKPPEVKRREPVRMPIPKLLLQLPPPELVPPIATAVPDSPVNEPPPPPAPPLTSAEETVAREAQFADRLKAAIQAAVIYPPAARAMGLHGEARVEFDFRDGAVRNVRVTRSSGAGLIDQAAIAAVMNAVVPPIPETLRGRDLAYQVTVVFSLK